MDRRVRGRGRTDSDSRVDTDAPAPIMIGLKLVFTTCINGQADSPRAMVVRQSPHMFTEQLGGPVYLQLNLIIQSDLQRTRNGATEVPRGPNSIGEARVQVSNSNPFTRWGWSFECEAMQFHIPWWCG